MTMARQLFWCVVIAGTFSPGDLLADTLRGVVRDEANRPLAEVRIDIATAAPKVGRGIFCPSCYLDCKKWTRTNEIGEFEISGLDPQLKFRVLSTAPGKQTRMTDLIDPSQETATLILADFPVDVPAERILEGTILGKEGTPIPGALVEPFGAKTSQRRWQGQVEAQAVVSDDHGHFKMLLPVGYLAADLRVTADGYAGISKELLQPGSELHEIIVPAGTTVTGKIVHGGKPQPGVSIAVVQTDRGGRNHFIKSVLSVADHEGRFEFRSLPASQQYAIFSPVGGTDPSVDSAEQKRILSTKTFQCRADNETRDLVLLELQAGLTLAGRLKMSDESALPEGLKLSLSRNPAWDLIEIPVQHDGRFSISGLPPETYEVDINAKGIRIDESGLRFQLVRPNSFGIRLTQSRDNIVVPLTSGMHSAIKVSSLEQGQEAESTGTQESDELPDVVDGTRFSKGSLRPSPEIPNEPTRDNGPHLRIRGTVMNSQGKRIRGASIILRAPLSRSKPDLLARSTTDANGRFTLNEIPIPLRMDTVVSNLISGFGGAQVLAFADGYGLTATEVQFLEGETLKMVLHPEADIKGTISDEQGHPISTARVKLMGITGTKGAVDDFSRGPGDISFANSNFNIATATDESGGFVLHHVPKWSRIFVSVEHPSYGATSEFIETSPSAAGVNESSKTTVTTIRKKEFTVRQSPLNVVLKKMPTVSVHIKPFNGSPIKNGLIWVHNPQKGEGYRVAVEGSDIVTVPIHNTGLLSFSYESDPLVPMLGARVKQEIFPENTNQVVEIRIPEPHWVTGRVVNSVTNEPIVGVRVLCASEELNGGLFSHSEVTSTKNGEFRVPAAVGKNRLLLRDCYGFVTEARLSNGQLRIAEVVDVPAEGDLPEVLLKLSPGLRISGTAVNSHDQPMGHIVVRAEQLDRPYLSTAVRTDEKGLFELSGLSPDARTLISAVSGAAAGRIVVAGMKAENYEKGAHQVIRLQLNTNAVLTGRVTKNGQPVAGVKMELSRSMPGEQNRSKPFTVVMTDLDGRYTVGGLEPGDRYSFKIITRDGSSAPNWRHQSRHVQTIADDHVGIRELPDAILVSNNQSLSGLVVDPDGNPVAGISVNARLKNLGTIPRLDNAAPTWTETDANGAFRFEQLPDETIELIAYKEDPATNRILYPAHISTDRNQTNLRIVVDPTLAIPVEDLDQR